MELPRSQTINRRVGIISATLLALALAGCTGVPTPGEREARRQVAAVQSNFRPQGRPAARPKLTTNSPLADFVTCALLRQPQVEAAYDDWVTSVENITVARSRPDPQLTFQMDIQSLVTSVMPGLVQSFPGPGKLRAQAEVATAESRARYFAFESAVLQTVYDLKQSYYRLWFLNDKLRVDHDMLRLLSELERIARARNEVGQVTLQDVYRARIEEDRLKTEITNLEDSRHPLEAQFKAALGLTRDEPDPPFPARLETTSLDLTPDQVLAAAFARNPQLQAMEAQVRQAQASLDLAYKARVPDFGVGLMADVKTSPVLYRPLATMTLPVWRDKIAAEIAAAQAGQRAARARLTATQIDLTVEFVGKSFDYREVNRNLALLQDQLIPQAQQSLEIARAAYLAGKTEFFNLMDTERTLLEFRLSAIEARTRRELVLSDLSLLIAGLPPAGAPLLPVAGDNQPASSLP